MNEIPIIFKGKGYFNSDNLLYSLVNIDIREFVGLFSSIENAKKMACYIVKQYYEDESEEYTDSDSSFEYFEIHIIDFLDKNQPIFLEIWANYRIDLEEGKYLHQEPSTDFRQISVIIDNFFE